MDKCVIACGKAVYMMILWISNLLIAYNFQQNIGWYISFGQFKLLPQSKLLSPNHQPCGRQADIHVLLEQLTFRLWDMGWKTHSVFNGLSICLLTSNISSQRTKNFKCVVSNSAYFWNFAYSILPPSMLYIYIMLHKNLLKLVYKYI